MVANSILSTVVLLQKIDQLPLLPYLIRRLRGGALGVILVFSVGLSLSASAGLIGIPLAFILSSWCFKCAYILFDNTVQGSNEPPTLDIQMMNPVDELRPVAQVIILELIIFALY